jgi:hypothetical protein
MKETAGMSHRPRPAAVFVLVVIPVAVAFALVASCNRAPAPAPEPEARAPQPVESPELGLRLADLPEGLAVASNRGTELVLAPADPAVAGRIVFEVMPPEAGQNIPAAVAAHQADIEAREGGDYQGSQELISPLGTTFYSRGRYLADGVELEETVIFALHPGGGRMMTVTSSYPAGTDSSVRVQQLLDVVAEVGAI